MASKGELRIQSKLGDFCSACFAIGIALQSPEREAGSLCAGSLQRTFGANTQRGAFVWKPLEASASRRRLSGERARGSENKSEESEPDSIKA